MLLSFLLPLLKLLLELEVNPEGFGVDLVEIWEEVLAKVLIIFIERFEHEDAGNYQENIGIAALYQILEFFILLRYSLYSPRKV